MLGFGQSQPVCHKGLRDAGVEAWPCCRRFSSSVDHVCCPGASVNNSTIDPAGFTSMRRRLGSGLLVALLLLGPLAATRLAQPIVAIAASSPEPPGWTLP